MSTRRRLARARTCPILMLRVQADDTIAEREDSPVGRWVVVAVAKFGLVVHNKDTSRSGECQLEMGAGERNQARKYEGRRGKHIATVEME